MHEYIKYELLWKFSRSRVEGGLEERLKGGGGKGNKGKGGGCGRSWWVISGKFLNSLI